MTTHAGRRALPADPRSRTLTVARSALVDRLRAEDDVPVVVVSAPAGSGKSVLLQQWADADPRPHVVVRLQPWSDSPGALADLVITGLDPLGPSLDELRAVATGEEPRFSAMLLPALAAATASREQPYVLVLDDVHLLHDERCHAVLAALAAAVPAGSQLALATRNAAPTWLARDRAGGAVMEIAGADLAFRGDEIGEVLALHGVRTTDDLIRQVADVTEGWPVGVYLVALLLAGTTDVDDATARLSGAIGRGRPIREYLRSQVLDPLDADTRSFLRATSLLDVVDAATGDAVLGRTDSLAVLRRLGQSVQLVVPLDETDESYRYHHLLQDVLQDELAELEPDRVPLLHVAAARWYLDRGDLDRAVRHSALSGDVPFAGVVISHNLGVPIGVGTPDRLEDWLRPLEDHTLASDPLLAISRCWLAIQRGDEADVATWLRRAEALAPDWPRLVGTSSAAGAVAVTALIAGSVPLARAGALADRIAASMPPETAFVSTAHVLGYMADDLAGNDPAARDRHAREAIAKADAHGVPSVVANTLSWQALVLLLDGDVAAARPLQERARAIVAETRLDRLATSGVTMSIDALYLAMSGRDAEAVEALGAARRQTLLMTGILGWFRVVGPLIHAATMALLGDPAGARRTLAEIPRPIPDELVRSARVRALTTFADEAIAASRPAASREAAALTTAELRVVQYLPSHLTLPQIAGRLFLSTNTVKTHVQAAYRKLGVASRDDAVLTARRLGLLETVPELDPPRRPAHPVRVDGGRSPGAPARR